MRIMVLLSVCTALASCASETVFQSNFDGPGTGPFTGNFGVQTVGTVQFAGSSGDVFVTDPPALPGPRWVLIGRAHNEEPVEALQCNLVHVPADGTYNLSAFLYMPARSGNRPGAQMATIQFEGAGQSINSFGSFLHIDLTQDNRLRVNDDDTTKFGTFPLDQVFTLQVRLNISASPSAHLSLSGAGASGEADVPLTGGAAALSHQFGAVRFWMGPPWTGLFEVTNIVVSRAQ